jgi:hypothetical protein
MRIFVALVSIGMLALGGAAPTAAQSTLDKPPAVGTATADDPAAERNTYTNHAQGEMHLWEKKLHDFNAQVETNTPEAQKSANKNLDNAWTETKTAWSRLVNVGLNVGTAGANDWDSAKASFQTTSDKLAVAWQKANPADEEQEYRR